MRWEYRTEPLDFDNEESLVAELNRLGAEGWELAYGREVSVQGATGKTYSWVGFIFKRPMPTEGRTAAQVWDEIDRRILGAVP